MNCCQESSATCRPKSWSPSMKYEPSFYWVGCFMYQIRRVTNACLPALKHWNTLWRFPQLDIPAASKALDMVEKSRAESRFSSRFSLAMFLARRSMRAGFSRALRRARVMYVSAVEPAKRQITRSLSVHYQFSVTTKMFDETYDG